MTENVRKDIEALRSFLVNDCIDFLYVLHAALHKAADRIESLSAQLDQVTRERDGLQMELDELKEEYYTDIHTARDPMLDKVKQLERERDAAVKGLARYRRCIDCARYDEEVVKTSTLCDDCSFGSNWQWRGVQVE